MIIIRIATPFVLFTLALLFTPADVAGQEAERRELNRLYDALDGDNWRNNTGWKTDAPLDQWHGIETTSTGHVRSIRLAGNRLYGEFWRRWSAFSRLERLELDNNAIYGEMPSELGSLSALRRLEIRGNELSGEIPSELGNLRQLEYLDLRSNDLTGEIPRSLGNLTNLEYLGLSSNRLSGTVPSSLARFFYRAINPQQNGVELELENQAIGPKAATAVEAIVRAAIGNEMAPGTARTIVLSDLFTFDATAFNVTYTAMVSIPLEGRITAAVNESTSTLTVTAIETGTARVRVDATATSRGSSAVIIGQLNANTAYVVFDVTVGPPAEDNLTFTLSGPDGWNVTEGESVRVQATASRAVDADTTVRLIQVGGTAAPADYTLSDIIISAGTTTGTAMLTATVDDETGSKTVEIRGVIGDLETTTVTFTIWDAAVPALPMVGVALLVALLTFAGSRRVRIRG